MVRIMIPYCVLFSVQSKHRSETRGGTGRERYQPGTFVPYRCTVGHEGVPMPENKASYLTQYTSTLCCTALKNPHAWYAMVEAMEPWRAGGWGRFDLFDVGPALQ